MVINVQHLAQIFSWKKGVGSPRGGNEPLRKVCGRIGAVDSDES